MFVCQLDAGMDDYGGFKGCQVVPAFVKMSCCRGDVSEMISILVKPTMKQGIAQ